MNVGEAKASEVKELIELAKLQVQQRHNIDLIEEIRYIGDFRSESEIEEIKKKFEDKDKKE